MGKVYIRTFGCTANKYDTGMIIGLLEKNGYKLSNLDDADYLIINTCGVKQVTENKVIYTLKTLSDSNRKLIIAGCLPKINLERIKKEVPNFTAILDSQSIHKIVEIMNKIENGQDKLIEFSERSPVKPRFYKKPLNSVIGILQISEGCNLACSYCCTRVARGKLQCYPPEDIIKEAECLVNKGFKELLVTSQDNGSYNFSDTDLPKLLKEICKIEGEFFVRVGMINPLHVKKILDDLIQIYKNEKIFKFLHLPVQSGSDKILKLMNRGYKVKDFVEIVERFKKELLVTISTDVIVGFPRESSSDFKNTLELIEKIKPDIVNISKFGVRPKTEAAEMKQLDKKTINKRSAILHKLVKKISLENNKKWIGWKGKVLVDEKIENGFIGRNFAYKPIVIKTKENLFGKFIDIEVINVTPNCLISRKA